MVKDVLTRIEDLHDFIEQCMNDESGITLLDKDVILQNLREIYQLSRKIEIDEIDIDDDMNGSDSAVVLFDNDSDSDREDSNDTEADNLDSEPIQEQDIVSEDIVVDEPVVNEPEIDIFADDTFTKEDRELLLPSLFEGDSDRYLSFVKKLNEFDDFDEAIIYTYESFTDRQASESLDIIVSYLEKRLN